MFTYWAVTCQYSRWELLRLAHLSRRRFLSLALRVNKKSLRVRRLYRSQWVPRLLLAGRLQVIDLDQ